MVKKRYRTEIIQREVRVLGAKDFEGYERNKPGSGWELIEYVDVKDDKRGPLRAWVPKYSLQNDYIPDFSQVKIVSK